jgi:hypothetical protein
MTCGLPAVETKSYMKLFLKSFVVLYDKLMVTWLVQTLPAIVEFEDTHCVRHWTHLDRIPRLTKI